MNRSLAPVLGSFLFPHNRGIIWAGETPGKIPKEVQAQMKLRGPDCRKADAELLARFAAAMPPSGLPANEVHGPPVYENPVRRGRQLRQFF